MCFVKQRYLRRTWLGALLGNTRHCWHEIHGQCRIQAPQRLNSASFLWRWSTLVEIYCHPSCSAYPWTTCLTINPFVIVSTSIIAHVILVFNPKAPNWVTRLDRKAWVLFFHHTKIFFWCPDSKSNQDTFAYFWSKAGRKEAKVRKSHFKVLQGLTDL